jgi:hypothetical protein
MNVVITRLSTRETIARYEVHLAGEEKAPPDHQYFDDAWQRAVSDGLVEPQSRNDYQFQLQRPKTLYESST